jgi:hypothetical protein
MTSISPLEQLNLTNDETRYVWYRRNVTLKRALANTIIRIQTRQSNAFVFFLNGQYLGEFDNHEHAGGPIDVSIAVDLSQFQSNQQYLLEILSISLGINNGVSSWFIEHKDIVGNVWLDEDLLIDNLTNINFWKHQKGLAGEYFQIYTEQGSSKVN